MTTATPTLDLGAEMIKDCMAVPMPSQADLKKAKKFKTLADSLDNKIEGFFADRQSNTPKRRYQAASARNSGVHLKRTQQALIALSDLHFKGEVPEILQYINNKKTVESLMQAKMDGSRCGYYDAKVDMGVPYHDTEQAFLLWSLISGESPEEKKTGRVKAEN